MAATIGALMVDIGANVARLQRDMNRAQGVFKKSTDTMRKVAASAGVAISAGLVSKALTDRIKETLKYGDAISKTSSKIGVQAEMLQELRYSAELAGVSQNTLDMAMQRFSRRVGEAVNGGGELKDTLDKYRISVTNADGSTRSLESILGDLSVRIKSARSEQERLRISFKAFDSEGAALVNMLKNGSSALKDMRKEARELGFIYDQQTLSRMERVNDNFTVMGRVLDGITTRVMTNLLPDIDKLVEQLANASKNASSLNKNIDTMTTYASDAAWAVGELVGTIEDLKSVADIELPFSAALPPGVAAAIATWKEIFSWIHRTRQESEKQDGVRIPIITLPPVTVIATTTDAIDNLSKSTNSLKIRMDELAGSPIKDGITNGLESYFESASDTANDIEKATASTFSSMEDYVSTFVATGKASFKDFANSVIADLARIVVRSQITAPLAGLVGNIFSGQAYSSASNYVGGELYSGATAGELSSYFSANANGGVYGALGKITAFAGGGAFTNSIVSKPTLFPFANGTGLMGEAGPEAIMPLTRVGGKLGVKAQGSGSQQNVNLVMNLDQRGTSSGDAKANAQAVSAAAEIALRKIKAELKRGGQSYALTRG